MSLPSGIEGLDALAQVPTSCLGALTECAISGTLNVGESSDPPAVEGVSVGVVKRAIAGIVTVLLESARADTSPEDVKSELEGRGLPAAHASAVMDCYAKSKQSLRITLARTQFSLPQVRACLPRLLLPIGEHLLCMLE